MDPQAAKYIGAGIACIGMGGAGVGVGTIFGHYLAAALRNPVGRAGPVRQPDLRLRGDRGARHLLAADRAAAAVRALSRRQIARPRTARSLESTMAQKNAQQITTEEHIPSSEHGKGFPPFDSDDLRVAAAVAGAHLRGALPADVAGRAAARRRDHREPAASASPAISPKRRAQGPVGRRHRGLREGAGGSARPRPDARQRGAREAGRGGGSRPQGRSTPSSTPTSPRPRRPSRRAAPRRWPMSADIATDAAAAIVERLTGTAPAEPAMSPPPSATRSSAEESDVRSRILGRGLLRHLRRRARSISACTR